MQDIDKIIEELVDIKIRNEHQTSVTQQYGNIKSIHQNVSDAVTATQQVIQQFEQLKFNSLVQSLKQRNMLDFNLLPNGTRHPYPIRCIGPDYLVQSEYEALDRKQRQPRQVGQEQERMTQKAETLDPSKWSQDRKAEFLKYLENMGEVPVTLSYLNEDITETIRNFYNLAQLFSEKKVIICKKSESYAKQFYAQKGWQVQRKDLDFVICQKDLDYENNGFVKGFINVVSFDHESHQVLISQYLPSNFNQFQYCQ